MSTWIRHQWMPVCGGPKLLVSDMYRAQKTEAKLSLKDTNKFLVQLFHTPECLTIMDYATNPSLHFHRTSWRLSVDNIIHFLLDTFVNFSQHLISANMSHQQQVISASMLYTTCYTLTQDIINLYEHIHVC